MKNLSRLIFFILFTLPLTGHAEKLAGACGIASGNGYAFSMTSPKGWIIDSESGRKFKIALVFYPLGTEWGKGDVMLYVRSRIKSGMIQSVDQQIEYTIQDYRAHGHPNYKMLEKTSRKLGNGTEVTIARFTGDSWGNHEMIGYINEEKVINFLVLNAHNEARFIETQPVFSKILDSYHPVTDPSYEYMTNCGIQQQPD